MSSTRPRVVFDCNVLLQAVAREQGPAAACLRMVERGFVSLYLSKPILREVRQILSDAVVRSKNLGLTDEVVNAFLRKDLLDLMSVPTPLGKQFRQRFPRLSILNPVEFLDELKRNTPEAFAADEP